tara:strand:+ start:1481 stop:2098 length:618 start_codon:yes stop_codon:yes gene_type:complete
LKKNKISKDWIYKQKKDQFIKKSKIEGFRSRSAYKLIEMNKKFKFFKNNTFILDLGSCPGGWSQVARKEIKKGKILAVDIKPMEKINNVDFIKGNLLEKNTIKKIMLYFNNKIDVVLSDMAANTTGNKSLDSYRTGELCLNAMDLAKEILSENGIFLSKVFMGSAFEDINNKAKECFKNIIKYKPTASRKESKEIYIFCKGIIKL